MRGIRLTHAASWRSTSNCASLPPSSSDAQVLRITILSVIRKKWSANSLKQCYYYVPGPLQDESAFGTYRVCDGVSRGHELCVFHAARTARHPRPARKTAPDSRYAG